MTGPTLIGPVLDDIIDNLTIVEMGQHLDDDVPCLVGKGERCDHAATWAVRCPTCGLDWTACDEHRGKIDRMDYITGTSSRMCAGRDDIGCKGEVPCPVNWRPL